MSSITNTSNTNTTSKDELEESILSLFVQRKSKSIKLETILDTFSDYRSHVIMKAVAKLCEEGCLLVLRDTTVVVNNYPLFIQHFMRFERIATAYLLYFIIKHNKQNIKSKRDVVFNYKIFFIPKFINDIDIDKVLLFFYRKEDQKFYKTINELRKRGLLEKKRSKYYDFIYSKIDPMLLEFLVEA